MNSNDSIRRTCRQVFIAVRDVLQGSVKYTFLELKQFFQGSFSSSSLGFHDFPALLSCSKSSCYWDPRRDVEKTFGVRYGGNSDSGLSSYDPKVLNIRG